MFIERTIKNKLIILLDRASRDRAMLSKKQVEQYMHASKGTVSVSLWFAMKAAHGLDEHARLKKMERT